MNALSFDAGAAGYDRFMGRWSRLYVPALLGAAGVAPGHRVLDVAAGTGEATALATAAVAPGGRVYATDISVPMLRYAAARVGGGQTSVLATDGQALAVKDGSFDAVVCQLGLMFFPDPGRGLKEIHRVLRPHGRVAACVWSAPERVPFIGILMDRLSHQLPDQRDALHIGFRLGAPPRLESLLHHAGFRDVVVTAESRRIVFASFEEYLEPLAAGGARAGQAYKSLTPEARATVESELRSEFRAYESGGRMEFEAEALIVSGRR